MKPFAALRRVLPSGARVVYGAIRTVLIIGLGLAALGLSILASVWGLSAVLVGVALVALVVLRTVHRARTPDAPSAARPQRAFVITAVFLLGFFVLLTVASQIWASH
jgi:cytochrome b561